MINLTVVIDNEEALRKFRELQKVAKNATSSVVTDFDRMDATMHRFATTLGQIGVGVSLAGLIRQIATTRGEFQQLEVAFTTLLQNKEKADALMRQMVDLAATTPFDLQGVANGARQLLAYGFAAEDITDTLTRLGNVAAGLGLPLERLTYLYGTTAVQGRVYARDMLQFTGSGIPVLQELAKMYGKTTEEINAMVSAGKIGFEDVKKVIENMTNAGGQFYNLMENQSKTITGLISNLGDAIDTMFNDIGKSQEGVISLVLQGTISLVENYQKVLNILIPLVAAYGAYKAALITTAALQKAMVAVETIQRFYQLAQGIQTAAQAQRVFNLAVKANPLGLALSLLTLIGTAIYRYSKNTTNAAKATAEYNRYLSEEKSGLDEAFRNLGKAEKGTKDRENAIDDINSKYGEYLSNMLSEASNANDIALAYKEISKAINDTAFAKAKAEFFDEPIKELQKAEKYFWNELGDFTKELSPTAQGAFTKEIEQIINKARQGGLGTSEYDFDKFIQAFRRAWQLDNPNQNISSSDLIDIIGGWDVNQVATGYQRIVRAANNLKQAEADFADFSKAYITSDNENIERQSQSITTASENLKKAQEAYNKAKAEWQNAIKEGADISVVQEKKTAVDTAEKALKEAKEAAGVDDKTIRAISNGQEKLSDIIRAGDLALQQSRIDIMKDGLKKELEQIDLNTEKKVQAIEEERKKELEASGLKSTDKLSTEREKEYAERTTNAQEEGDAASVAAKLKYAKELDTIYKQITDSSLTEEERRVRGIKDKYAGLREWVKKALEGGTITQEQASALGLKIDQAETVDTLKGIIDAYGTAEDKITKIQQEAESARKTAREQGRDDLISQIDKQEQEDIGAIKAEELMKTDDWINLFQNLDALSSKEIRRIIDNINDQLKNANLDPINLKTITDQLQKASDTATKKNPFAGIINGFKDLKKARQDADIARKKYNKEQTEENKQASNQADIEVIEKRKKAWLAAAEGIEIARTALEGVTSIAEMFGADEDTVGVLNDVTGAIGGIGTAVQGFASGNIAQGIQGVFSALGSIFNIFSGDRKKERNIKRLQEQVEALEKSYDKLGDAVERSYSKDAKGLIEDQNELLKQQKVLIEQQIKEEQSKKKSDKDRIKEWEEQLEEINQKIKENKEAALDALFGEDVKSQIDNFANALIEAWEAGDSKAKASKDIVKSMIKNMITEAMKMDISPFMDNLRAKMEEFWNDNIISQQEEEILNQMANEQAKNLSNKYAWADRFFNEENKTGQEATYGGYETLSEDTGQKLDGRFAAIQMIAEDIKEYSRQSIGINSDNKGLLEKNNLVSIDIRDIQVEQLNYLKIISSNTDRLEAVEKYLGKICKYTKNLE